MPVWADLSFQNSASPLMEQLAFFHDFTMIILSFILTLVGVQLSLICKSSLTNRFLLHSQTVEISWTIAPVFLLLAIALPSLQILYVLDDPFAPSLTIKTTGHQWFWSYEYSDFLGQEFDSYMNSEKTSCPRLLDADNSLILPVKTQIRMMVTSSDVIHAWTMPTLGLKVDAVPGRLNQLMLLISRPSLLFGQCSEICGANHSFMPIKVEAWPINPFLSWLKTF
uniref:Cytochrome c oxidase subunit 2 n=1 Tax=Bactrurus brachycaudus TaxID=111554 RepID=A0A6C0X4U4_9CRUS|nr:cytochrome c oxidase subunit II [Bactrurus brachycaudus]QIC54381.1 cytochrome c oxidase subunit II [Bactrurus brachycaudus]